MSPSRPGGVVFAAVVVLAGLVDGCTAPMATAPAGPDGGASPGTTAEQPASPIGRPLLPGAPGELISATPIAGAAHTHGWAIAYHSRTVDDRDIAVTGVLVAPDGPGTSRPIITWGHPTTGSADSCAPSRARVPQVPNLDQVAARGWTIVASDYEGLGTTGAHPYLVGASEAHALLDAARAARAVDGAGVTPASPTVIWGFSQGGHAAAFAGELASAYAPELTVAGVALAAPVTDVAHFARRAEQRSDQFGVLVTIVGGFASAYPELDPSTVFTPEVLGQLPVLEQQCIGAINETFNRPLPTLLRAPATDQAAFATRFAENQAGRAENQTGRTAGPTARTAPMLVVQGAGDDIVDPLDTSAYIGRVCASGAPVDYVVRPDGTHGVMGEQPFLDWTAARLAGAAAPSTC